MTSRKITIHSRAKLNLFLKVLDKRDDGFHNIISVFQAIDYADELTFTMEKGRTGITLRSTNSDIPLGKDNLIVRAYHELAEIKELKSGDGIVCNLKKIIPVGAGMGGGSSNCASALIVLNDLLETGLDQQELMAIGAKLGSDVPFFFRGGTCFVHGRGEKIEMIPPITTGAFLIVTPSININTSDAYSMLDDFRNQNEIEVADDIDILEMRDLLSQAVLDNNIESILYNDFERAILEDENYNEIQNLKHRLEQINTLSLITGSGSSVFTYFSDANRAWQALENYEPLNDENVCIAQPVSEGYLING